MKNRDDGASRAPTVLSSEPLPLVEERLLVSKEWVPVGRVRVKKRASARVVDVPSVTLARERVTVERVPVERFVDTEPSPRVEGDVVILPLVEEVLVKRLFLREELWLRKVASAEASAPQQVTLRSEEAVIEREALGGGAEGGGEEHPRNRGADEKRG